MHRSAWTQNITQREVASDYSPSLGQALHIKSGVYHDLLPKINHISGPSAHVLSIMRYEKLCTRCVSDITIVSFSFGDVP